ncbi:MAG: pyridoxal phosphate-dependent aminotransferase [Planctomycetota bacterium]
MLSQRVRVIEPSATFAVNSLRLKLQSEGKRIVNFGAGEPDFDTPAFITEAGIQALRDGWTRYTPVAGVPALRAAVAEKIGTARGVTIEPEQVIITSGAKQACAEVMLARVDPGDEVLLPAPYWVSYPELVRLADGIPVVVPTQVDSDYKVTPQQLEQHVTPRTVGLVLNTPSNPTGAVYSHDEVEAIVAFADSHDLWIMSDEIYDRFVYEGEFASPYRAGVGAQRTMLVSGVSKTYAMTGWRIGWTIADQETIAGMGRLQGHAASNAAAVSQGAALAAVQATDESFLDDMIDAYRGRRERAIELLSAIPGLRFPRPAGSFYVFLDLGEILGRDGGPQTGGEFCEQVLAEHGVAMVPGEAFGDPQGARISYCCSIDEVEQGIQALHRFVDALA